MDKAIFITGAASGDRPRDGPGLRLARLEGRPFRRQCRRARPGGARGGGRALARAAARRPRPGRVPRRDRRLRRVDGRPHGCSLQLRRHHAHGPLRRGTDRGARADGRDQRPRRHPRHPPGACRCCKATPGAHVLSMGSASGVYGVPDLATYSASEVLRPRADRRAEHELEGDGIVVTDLMPLYVDTPMVRARPRAGSLETFGARLTPRQIGELAWTAIHGRRVHWRPGLLLKTLNYLGGALPFVSRPTMKYVGRRRAGTAPS